MSSHQVRKPKPESYAYSWFLPAEGNNGSVIISQLPPPELEGTAITENPKVAAMEARTEEWRHSGERKVKSGQKYLSIDPTRLRFAGIAGWSAIAAIGGLLLSTRAGSFPGLQLGILAGAWIGVSAAIWFVPGIISSLSFRGH